MVVDGTKEASVALIASDGFKGLYFGRETNVESVVRSIPDEKRFQMSLRKVDILRRSDLADFRLWKF